MAADTIRRLFFTPPIAIARLGGSSTPLEAFGCSSRFSGWRRSSPVPAACGCHR